MILIIILAFFFKCVALFLIAAPLEPTCALDETSESENGALPAKSILGDVAEYGQSIKAQTMAEARRRSYSREGKQLAMTEMIDPDNSTGGAGLDEAGDEVKGLDVISELDKAEDDSQAPINIDNNKGNVCEHLVPYQLCTAPDSCRQFF